MEEQPSPTTQMPSAQQRYRVRRRRTEPLDSHVSSADAAPKMRIRVRSGEYSVVGAVSSPAQDSTASGIPIGVAGEALNVSNPAADVEDCDRTLEADEQSVAPAFCTPRTLSEDMNSAGLDGVQVIDFAYKLVATKQVLRASSFDAAPEVCADGHSLPIASNFSRSNAQEMMISNESVPDCPESLADLTTSRSTQLAMEVSNMEQRPDEVANEPNQSFQGRALIKDGVRIIDFAYAYAAMSPKQSPKRGKGRARFASRSENAPSVHHKSTSKDVRVSTASANNIVDLEASQPERITTGLRFKDEVRGSPQNSNEDGLLLLQFSVYTPPDQAEPSGSQGSDGASMTILPSSVYTPPDTVQGNDDQEADDTLTLKLLPASVYTRPDPMERWHGADVEGLLITDSYRADAASPYVRKQDSSASQIEAGGSIHSNSSSKEDLLLFPGSAYTPDEVDTDLMQGPEDQQTNKDSRAKKEFHENLEYRRFSSQAIAPRSTAEASPATAHSITGEHCDSTDFQTPSAQAYLEAPFGNDETEDSVYAKPTLDWSGFMGRLLGFFI